MRSKRWKREIYLDTAAATPLDPSVRRAMAPYWADDFANPSSLHRAGVVAARAVDVARRQVAAGLGAHVDEIIFTSGGTEANNLAIFGVGADSASGRLATTPIEHPSVLEPARALTGRGWLLDWLSIGSGGLIDLKALPRLITNETKLVSVHYANHEIGVIQPIREVAKIIRRARRANHSPYPYFHVDAAQAIRFLPLKVDELGVDLLTINAQKIYGPKGVGALYLRRGVSLEPQILGGGQEANRRSGTENVPGIVGLAAALELCVAKREGEAARLIKLRDYLIKELLALGDSWLNGSAVYRLPHHVNVTFHRVEAERLVLELDAHGIACSSASACTTRDSSQNGSYVITALGQSESVARESIRFTLGRETKLADLRYVIRVMKEIVPCLRADNNLIAKFAH